MAVDEDAPVVGNEGEYLPLFAYGAYVAAHYLKDFGCFGVAVHNDPFLFQKALYQRHIFCSGKTRKHGQKAHLPV